MPAHLVYGDTFLASQTIRDIKNEANLNFLFDSNTQRLQASQTTPNEVITYCNTVPFLDPYRLIVIEGILSPEPTTTRRRRNQPSQDWGQLADAISFMPPSTVLVLLDQNVPRNSAMLRKFSPYCTVHAKEAPTGNALRQWIVDSIIARKAKIYEDALHLMEEIVGSDLWALDREIEKLCLYCVDRPIEIRDINRMVSHTKEANIFAAMDAVTEGRPGQAIQMITRLIEDGTEPMNILGMIVRQVRLMALAKDYSEREIPLQQWSRELGFTTDFICRKASSQARKFSNQDIQKIYGLTLQADQNVKTSTLEASLAVELLATDIATIVQ